MDIQLFEQIEKALEQNDMQTVAILIQGENRSELQEFLQKLKSQINKKKFNQFLDLWDKQQGQRKDKEQNDDKIRKINQKIHKLQSDSEQNIIQKQIKAKKQMKLQQKFGYQFYGNIKCLMIAYGDLRPNEEAIKMMHSQVQVLFQIISKFLIQSQQQKKIKAGQKSYQNCIQLIFKQETVLFEQIFRSYKKVKKATKSKPEQSESQLEQYSSSDQQDIGQHHMDSNSLQQSQYFALLTKNMNEKQYQSYAECRSINFMQNSNNKKNQQNYKKFINFLGLGIKLIKIQTHFISLLSFICCRFIRKIILQIIRLRNVGNLNKINSPITTDEVRKIGNNFISHYEKQIQRIKIEKQTEQEKAKKKFISDFNDLSFRSLLPKIYIKSNKSAQQIWAESPHYREMWIQRYIGELEIQTVIQDIQNMQINSQYGKFILKNLQFYKSKGSNFLWRKYFTQQKIIKQNEVKEQIGKPKKKVKLESIKN